MKKSILLFLASVFILCCGAFAACNTEQAQTEPTVHTVTVDDVEQKVLDGQRAVKPKDPVLQGYTFTGWMCEGSEYDWSAPVKKNLTIVSSWEDAVNEEKLALDSITFEVAAGSSVASSTWKAEYTGDGIAFSIVVTDDSLYTDSADKGMNDNVELVLQAVPSVRYDTVYTFDFLANAKGEYWFKRASGAGSFGEDGAYDLFVKEGENLRYEIRQTEDGYTVNVFFAYELLNTTYAEAYGNIRFCPSMRNSASGGMSYWDSYKEHSCTWTRPMNFLVIDENNRFTLRPAAVPDLSEAFEASELYKEGEPLLENLASLVPEGDGKLAKAEAGADAFSDRFYGFEGAAMPSDLVGLSYVLDGIDGSRVTVEEEGFVVMIAPHSGYESLVYEIERDGWTKIYEKGATVATITPGGGALTELADYYVKKCEAGEEISFGKYYILFGAPAEESEYYVHPSMTEPTEFLTDFTGYEVLTRNWQGVTSLEISEGGRLFATWVSGGDGEPRAENYDVIVYSDDGGESWNDLWIIDHPNDEVKINDAQLWRDPDGTLWIFYCQSKTGSSFDRNAGVWCVTVEDPDAPQLVHSEPRRLFGGLLRNNITVLSDGTWLAFPNDFIDDTNTVCYASEDKGQTWQVRGGAFAPQAFNFDETMAVELEDGTLWMMIRNSNGKLLESYSYDKGHTWTDAVYTDIDNPTSRFFLGRMPSGNLLFINNDSASGRNNMTAFISEDEGKTWQYQCLLDARQNTSYPDVAFADDGTIYAIWDQDRINTGNIILATFTEQDIKENTVLPAGKLRTISSASEFTVEAAEGETLGDGTIFEATGGFDAACDDGTENAQVVQKGENSQYIYFKNGAPSEFYAETELRAMSIANGDDYPKFGITVRSEKKTMFFYIDGQREFHKYTAGVVLGDETSWDWDNAVEVPANVHYSREFVRLGVLRKGADFIFYVNGRAVIEQSFADFSSAAADVGFLTFNTRAIFRNYKLVTDASELEAIESAPQPKTSVLFFGDSFVDMYHWETFYEDIADEDAVNVGIGGTKVQLWIDNFDDYILRYQPEKVVMHIGVNDIDGGTSGADTFAMLQELFGLFKEKLPDTEIYFISVSPSVNYWNRHEEVDAVNALVSQLSESEENLHFIDLASELYCEDGSYVREELYEDGLHLNKEGYAIWTGLIKQALGME